MPCKVPEEFRKRIIRAVERDRNDFICMNDIRNLTVFQVASEHSWQINKDIGVTGNFNTFICELLTPQLTSVDLNVPVLAEVLMNALPGNNGNKTVHIQPNIIKSK